MTRPRYSTRECAGTHCQTRIPSTKQLCAECKDKRRRQREGATGTAYPICESCVFEDECRMLNRTRSLIDVYCFPSSEFYHNYVREYLRNETSDNTIAV